jgi:tetratricopeptide (TPR) repeat protein
VAASDRFLTKFGCPFLFADCRWHYGSALYSTGKWDEAELELRAAMRESKPDTDYHMGSAARLSEIYVHRGQFAEAEAMAEKLGDRPIARRIVGVIKHAKGEHKLAIAYLQRFIESCGSNIVHATSALDLLVDACLASGNVPFAEVAAGRLADLGVNHRSKIVRGHVAFAAGRVALARGDQDHARRELERAIELFGSTRLQHDAARARLALAQALAGSEQDLAMVEARSASVAFTQLGATRNASVAAELMRTLGG